MDHFAPADWSGNMGDALAPFSGEDDGLVELLWRSGHVFMQSQAPPRPAVREQEEAPWFQYSVANNEDDGSLEKDLFSEFFAGMPADGLGGPCKKEDLEERDAAATALLGGLMSTPQLLTEKAGLWGEVARGSPASEDGESSAVTIGSRGNHAQTPGAPLRGGKASDAMSHHNASATLTSLSTWSRPSAASKRKLGDGAESLSEVIQDVESESADEPARKPTTGKRRRVAQVHNLSERRRRDRINEKLRALQELVPHCNKTDKASMLDEAIEYLKSLQLQLQIMWAIRGGMAPAAPVMFPAGAQQYVQRMASMRSTRMPPFRTCLYSSNDAEQRILRDR